MSTTVPLSPRARAADARNRAARTLLQGLAVDVAIAVVLLLTPVITAAGSWGDFDWAVLGFLLAKTVAVTVLSYVMRTWLDRAGLAPQPPTDTEPVVPAEDVVAQRGPTGGLVAGQGAATIPTGAPVDVTAMH